MIKATTMVRAMMAGPTGITRIPTLTTKKEKTSGNKESLVETSFKVFVDLKIIVGMIIQRYVFPGKN